MKLLILGANGMVGSMMTKFLSSYHDVIPWTRQHFDAEKDIVPDLHEYDYVINCIGLIKQKSSDESLLYKLNAQFPLELSKQCKKLFHISSDCVFSGNLSSQRLYERTDKPDAQDAYGKAKAEGEAIDNAMILRTSVIGPAKDSSGLFEWFKNTKENTVKGFTNHWWSGVTTLELSKIIAFIIQHDLYFCGLTQIASIPVSKYLLLCQINEIFACEKTITPYKSDTAINRSLAPNYKGKDLYLQLRELKDFICM